MLLGLAALTTTGCASAVPDTVDEPTQTRALELKLTGNGTALRFASGVSGVGANGYRPDYPNPKRLGTMTVGVKSSGEIVASCTAGGASVTCLDTPFVTEVQASAGGGVDVIVLDVYGVVCGRQHFASKGGASGDARASSGAAGSAGGGAGGPVGYPAEDSGTSGGYDDGDDGGERGGNARPACDEAGAIATRDAYCGAINAWLKKHDMPKIDCALLDVPGYDTRPDAPKHTPDTACDDIWGDPYVAIVMRWSKDCYDQAARAVHWNNVVRWQLISEGACAHSPLVLDLDGDGVHLGSVDRGVAFDLLGGGSAVTVAWPEGDDAFLALDRNGNARIDDASELFGQATSDGRYEDGFAALGALDENGDGVLDAQDAAFAELVVWRDRDHDGVSQSDELLSLASAGVRRLDTLPVRVGGEAAFDPHGNRIPLVGSFERADGTHARLVDAFLRYRPR
jgi:hypothetical protein